MITYRKLKDGVYSVIVDGTVIGKVERYYPTIERRSSGKRYVNARWTAKTPAWRAIYLEGYVSPIRFKSRLAAAAWIAEYPDL